MRNNLPLDELFEAACCNRIINRLELQDKIQPSRRDSERIIDGVVIKRLIEIRDALINQGLGGLGVQRHIDNDTYVKEYKDDKIN